MSPFKAQPKCATNRTLSGQLLDYDLLPDEDRALLRDYQLIQYDMSVGRGYLHELAFMDIR